MGGARKKNHFTPLRRTDSERHGFTWAKKKEEKRTKTPSRKKPFLDDKGHREATMKWQLASLLGKKNRRKR